MRKQMGIIAVLVAAGAVSAGVLETAEPGALFIEGSNVVFTAAAAVEGVDAHVVDVFGDEVRRGRVVNGRLDVGILPKGYYVARIANGEQTETRSFGVVVDPARRVRDAESPFAIDAALAAIVPKDANYARMLNRYAEVLRRVGVVNVRDRFHQQLDANGDYRWGHYGQAADALARSGARVSETMHVFASARRLAGSSEPRSLIEVYDFARCQAERFPSVAIWEFWNETELSTFWNGSAWGVAAAMTEQLAGCTALGRVALAAGVTEHLYRRPDGQKTLAYWSESRLDQTSAQNLIRFDGDLLSRRFTIPAAGTLQLAGLFGTPGEGVALRADRMSLGADADSTNRWLVLEITNLSETPRRGTLSASEAWLRLPEAIELAPRGADRYGVSGGGGPVGLSVLPVPGGGVAERREWAAVQVQGGGSVGAGAEASARTGDVEWCGRGRTQD